MKLDLYHRWECPYSARVREFVTRNGLSNQVRLIEVSEVPGARERLLDTAGRLQVPCLMVNDNPFFDSNAIIRWLEKNLLGSQLQI